MTITTKLKQLINEALDNKKWKFVYSNDEDSPGDETVDGPHNTREGAEKARKDFYHTIGVNPHSDDDFDAYDPDIHRHFNQGEHNESYSVLPWEHPHDFESTRE